ncbi:MAG: hypothetical protein ACO1SX_20840 [Actinomycetota bacterium]
MTDRWRNVNRTNPCTICGHDSWCFYQEGIGRGCRRIEGPAGSARLDKTGLPYWYYPESGGRSPALKESARVPDTRCLEPEGLNVVYSALLGLLHLTPDHRQSLRNRGLSDQEIDLRQYRTLPERGRAAVAKRLVQRFEPHVCSRVPGIYEREENGRRWWSLAGHAGLLIPVRDAESKIVALRLRPDTAAGPRYMWFSSRTHQGPGPGSKAHVPLGADIDRRVIRLTEGELKADVATALTGTLTLSLPGVALIHVALPILEELRPETVIVAFDVDWHTNPHVQRALRNAIRVLEKLECK